MKTPLLLSLLLLAQNSLAQLPDDYQTWFAEEKQEWLWNNIEAEAYGEDLPGFGSNLFLQALGSSALLSLEKTMTHESDEMPEGRIKFIHTFGSCAKAEFEMTHENPYSGLFQTGAPAIIRLGWAAPPQLVGHTPGMAIKLLVDGQSSKNLQVMKSLDGQGANQNYFQHVFSNIIPEPEGKLLQTLSLIFKTASTNPLELTLDHVASVDLEGNLQTKVRAPRQILFQPTPQAQLPTYSPYDLRQVLASKFNANTVLYRIYAAGLGRGALNGQNAKLIGRLVLRSEFVASEYCDRQLFFQHTDTFLRR
jgi:hypothetical protein